MAYVSPYRQHNYMGQWANTGSDAEAIAGIAAMGFTVADGMWYYDTTNSVFRVRQGGAWTTLSTGTPATPTLAAVLAQGNQSGGSDLIIDTGDVLTITDAPTDATDAANKSYVDSVAAGLSWKAPVQVWGIKDGRDQSGVDPTATNVGEAWLVLDWASFNDGDIVEWDGTQWNLILANSGGEPPDGTRVLIAPGSWNLGFPFDAFSGGQKIVVYNAATDSWSLPELPADGDAALVIGENSIFENKGYVYDDDAVIHWVQFTGIAELIAGLGLSKTGVTVAIKADEGAVRTADGSEEITNNPLYLDSTNGLNVKIDNSTIGLDSGNDYRLYIPNGGVTGTQLNSSVAGNGLTGGGGSALAVGAGNGVTVAADAVAVKPADVAGKGGILVDSDGVYTCRTNAGNPNTVVTGDLGQLCYDTTNNLTYIFTSSTSGNNSWEVL